MAASAAPSTGVRTWVTSRSMPPLLYNVQLIAPPLPLVIQRWVAETEVAGGGAYTGVPGGGVPEPLRRLPRPRAVDGPPGPRAGPRVPCSARPSKVRSADAASHRATTLKVPRASPFGPSSGRGPRVHRAQGRSARAFLTTGASRKSLADAGANLSSLGTVPKKEAAGRFTGKVRPVIDLRHMNKFLTEHLEQQKLLSRLRAPQAVCPRVKS
jgi:hypothetical protein